MSSVFHYNLLHWTYTGHVEPLRNHNTVKWLTNYSGNIIGLWLTQWMLSILTHTEQYVEKHRQKTKSVVYVFSNYCYFISNPTVWYLHFFICFVYLILMILHNDLHWQCYIAAIIFSIKAVWNRKKKEKKYLMWFLVDFLVFIWIKSSP